jgi:hypothetical protein
MQVVGCEKSEVAMRVVVECIERYAEKYLAQGP